MLNHLKWTLVVALTGAQLATGAPQVEQPAASRWPSLLPTPLPPRLEYTPDSPTIEVADQGREPRQVLRYAPEGLTSAMLRIEIRSLRRVEENGMPTSREEHAADLQLELGIRAVDDGFEVQAVRPPSETAGDGDNPPVVLPALTARARFDRRGIMQRLEMDVPPDSREQIESLARFMEGLLPLIVVPFPEEAVGAGARWTVRMEAASDRWFESEDFVDYELEVIAGDALLLGIRTRRYTEGLRPDVPMVAHAGQYWGPVGRGSIAPEQSRPIVRSVLLSESSPEIGKYPPEYRAWREREIVVRRE